ncbi:VOC family protein [Micromonospora tarensis]|uniref:VOC family protein n=1 Tax=Micromonospora tarensis TaxID=2806100 RepID=A0ABS1YMJ3_9ACTN|nr:VOC family protein [Micromonospora tarensis]MBM0278663.1 VOC family protein [Micromonospora tarensis]
MLSPTLTVTFDAYEPARLARFWAGLLDRKVIEDSGSALLPGDDTQVSLRIVPSQAKKLGPNRIHLHLTSASSADQQHRVATALKLGGSHLDVGQLPEEEHIVLADPEGNEFCVIEAGNGFLAGCGLLGELACDGTRDVGLFWSEALGWPLVWDQDEETAIQSPRGGTKVAWGGPPLAPKLARNRQRFDLAPPGGDQRAEVDRLLALGATRVEVGADGAVMLADPDGNEFCVS